MNLIAIAELRTTPKLSNNLGCAQLGNSTLVLSNCVALLLVKMTSLHWPKQAIYPISKSREMEIYLTPSLKNCKATQQKVWIGEN